MSKKRKQQVRPRSMTGRHTLESLVTSMTTVKARALTQREPKNPLGWKQLGAHLSAEGKHQEALDALGQALTLTPDDPEILAVQGRLKHRLGNVDDAINNLKRAVALRPNYAKAHNYLGYIYYTQAKFDPALEHADKACQYAPDDVNNLNTLGNVLAKRFEYTRAREVLARATKLAPDEFLSWNNLGNIQMEMGELDGAIKSYRRAHQCQLTAPGPFSNLITAHHYHPRKSGAEINALSRQWNALFSPQVTRRRVETPRDPAKLLRIGLISDGFRGHPVGRMITSALEWAPKDQVALHFYSTNNANDGITERLKATAESWMSIQHLDDSGVADQIEKDEIDILIDLAGHNSGNRVLAVAMKPAPLVVKWVGGLINTTGVEAIDYLISDSIETPPDVDDNYVEKLIRLPDDYICYDPPGGYEPDVGELPARRNGYITFGCFNNAAKLNDVLLGEWASLMQAAPGSRLYLKSMQYQSQERCQQIFDTLGQHGIERERILIEGPSPHAELLDAYNRVDIALDPWPYSGGLTTCEAFLMGVPVVSLPGPTFAGRHSATHLVNAGMPELVVASWEEYRARVLDLISDLDSLATIRSHLRQVLLESPVCDARRFAGHFTMAMRAIWQRHCAGKAPEALTFDKDSRAWFEDDGQTLDLEPPQLSRREEGFRWRFDGKIVAIDNGGQLLNNPIVRTLLGGGNLELIAFDPVGEAGDDTLKHHDGVHYYSQVTLGDGQSATWYACLDPEMSGSLSPRYDENMMDEKARGCRVLTRLPLNTLALNKIEGLPSLDWLVLDARNDSATILKQGETALKDTLLVQAKVAFQSTHERQPNLAELQHWAARHGFRLYAMHSMVHQSQLPHRDDLARSPATELTYADAVFVPDRKRLKALSDSQKMKLAFLLHTIYRARDLVYQVVRLVNDEMAEHYLEEEGLIRKTPPDAPTDSENTSASDDKAAIQNLPDAPHMTQAERALFGRFLQHAESYFEFGSGGSTVWAVRRGLIAHGVESDQAWVNSLKKCLGEKCRVEAVDIGPTGDWGLPLSSKHREKFPDYSLSILKHECEFDRILVDGRFRVACTLAAVQHIMKRGQSIEDTRIFIHDFWNRPVYHVVLEFLDEVESVESAGIFKIKAGLVPETLEKTWKKWAHNPA